MHVPTLEPLVQVLNHRLGDPSCLIVNVPTLEEEVLPLALNHKVVGIAWPVVNAPTLEEQSPLVLNHRLVAIACLIVYVPTLSELLLALNHRLVGPHQAITIQAHRTIRKGPSIEAVSS